VAVTLAELKARTRARADMPDPIGLVSDTELLGYINSAYCSLYQLIVAAYTDDYTKSATLTVAAGSDSVSLPTDFFQLRGVDWQTQTLRPFNFHNRNDFQFTSAKTYQLVGSKLYIRPTTNAAGTYTVWYIPAVTQLVLDADTVTVPNRWDEYIVLKAAINCLNKEETNTTVHSQELAELTEEIKAAAMNRNAGDPETIADTSGPSIAWL
jgi:hypothetical protein